MQYHTNRDTLALKEYGSVGLLDADIYGPSIPRMMGALNQKPAVTAGNQIEPLTRYGIKMMSIGFLVDEASAVVWRGPMLFKAMDQFFVWMHGRPHVKSRIGRHGVPNPDTDGNLTLSSA